MDAYQLFENNISLAGYTIKTCFNNLIGDEDILQCAYLGLWKGCMTYNESKSAVSTYCMTCIKNEIYMELRRRSKNNGFILVSLDEPIRYDDADKDSIHEVISDPKSQNAEEEILFLDALKRVHISDREKKILNLYRQSKNQKTVADAMGISQSVISRTLSRVRKRVHSQL